MARSDQCGPEEDRSDQADAACRKQHRALCVKRPADGGKKGSEEALARRTRKAPAAGPVTRYAYQGRRPPLGHQHRSRTAPAPPSRNVCRPQAREATRRAAPCDGSRVRRRTRATNATEAWMPPACGGARTAQPPKVIARWRSPRLRHVVDGSMGGRPRCLVDRACRSFGDPLHFGAIRKDPSTRGTRRNRQITDVKSQDRVDTSGSLLFG
jgi:hypothetical protein